MMSISRAVKKTGSKKPRELVIQAGMCLSASQVASIKKVVTDSKPKPFARGTIEDRMDSENAGIVFLD